jgi:DNA-binding LacI/PurR family transcriptional regulator
VRRVVSHLISLNHRRIACIVYTRADPHARRRLDVFRDTLLSAGIVFDERLLRFGDHDPESGYEAMKSILESGDPPTAVFGMNDMMAFGAITAIREAGLSVPQDIAVVGYDGVRESRFTYPPLTTARAPEVELGRRAAEVVLDMLEGKPVDPAPILLQSELIIRESCGAN